MSVGCRVGFVGLGDQGEPMARRIARAGYPLTVWARRPEQATALAADGATVADSLPALAEGCDLLGVCVGDDADVREIADAVLPVLEPGAVLAVHSTVSPRTCVDLAARAGGVHVVDAPVSGGRARAAAGELTVMVGGSAEAFALVEPVFGTFGALVSHVGPVGSGQVLKLLNNLAFTAQLAVTADVVAVAEGLGLDLGPAARALAASTGGSRSLEFFVAGGAEEVFPRHQDGRARGAQLLAKDNALGRAELADRGVRVPPAWDALIEAGLALAEEAARRDPSS